MIILQLSYDHLAIILCSSFEHISIISWSSYDRLTSILELPCDHLTNNPISYCLSVCHYTECHYAECRGVVTMTLEAKGVRLTQSSIVFQCFLLSGRLRVLVVNERKIFRWFLFQFFSSQFRRRSAFLILVFIRKKCRQDIQYNDIQHVDNATRSIKKFRMTTLYTTKYCNSECHTYCSYAEWRYTYWVTHFFYYAEYRYTESGSCRVSPLFMVMLRCDAEYCYAECRPSYCYAECRYPECHGAPKISCFAFQKKKKLSLSYRFCSHLKIFFLPKNMFLGDLHFLS